MGDTFLWDENKLEKLESQRRYRASRKIRAYSRPVLLLPHQV